MIRRISPFSAYPRDGRFVSPQNKIFPSQFESERAIDFSIPEGTVPRSEVFSGGSLNRIPYAELQDCPDEQLVNEICGGNTDGFAVIFKRYHRLVHITALNIVRDAGEAEDLTQTVFLEIYRHLRQFDPARGTLKVWLLQFAYSRSMHRRNYLFVRQFHKQVNLGEADARASHWSPSRLQPQEATRLTGEALSVLPEPQRRTIEMFFFEGLTLREIAERRNENYPNVRNHYYRGLERLRSYLQSGPPPVAPTIVPTGEA
jgi:RNA polymerase sigma-70 factor (ECF subfamily)